MIGTSYYAAAMAGLLAAGFLFAASVVGSALSADRLDLPARPSALAARSLVTGLASAGGHLVAVGQRGHVLVSADGGQHWTQSKVPLSSDLTAVQFVDAHVGYAVGHDGVVLRSSDGGASWSRVLDGRKANRLLLDYMRERVAIDASDANRALLREAERNVELGPDKPFLELWFSSADEGFVVGAYNLIFHTADGGRSWQPWFDRTDNPRLLNLHAIRPYRGALFIAGESGLLLRLAPKGRRFTALQSPYAGSWFGLVATRAGLLAYGMLGNAWLSTDQGVSWKRVDSALQANITASAQAADGSVWLAEQGGGVSRSIDGGRSFKPYLLAAPAPVAAMALRRDAVVLGGPRGLQRISTDTTR
jgi:photosystem II stability/assembly factor-like uncharacterized protein